MDALDNGRTSDIAWRAFTTRAGSLPRSASDGDAAEDPTHWGHWHAERQQQVARAQAEREQQEARTLALSADPRTEEVAGCEECEPVAYAAIDAAARSGAAEAAHRFMGQLTCPLCTKAHKTPAKLANHVEREHPGATAQQLADCGATRCPVAGCGHVLSLITNGDKQNRSHCYNHLTHAHRGAGKEATNAAHETWKQGNSPWAFENDETRKCLDAAGPGTPGSTLSLRAPGRPRRRSGLRAAQRATRPRRRRRQRSGPPHATTTGRSCRHTC